MGEVPQDQNLFQVFFKDISETESHLLVARSKLKTSQAHNRNSKLISNSVGFNITSPRDPNKSYLCSRKDAPCSKLNAIFHPLTGGWEHSVVLSLVKGVV